MKVKFLARVWGVNEIKVASFVCIAPRPPDCYNSGRTVHHIFPSEPPSSTDCLSSVMTVSRKPFRKFVHKELGINLSSSGHGARKLTAQVDSNWSAGRSSSGFVAK